MNSNELPPEIIEGEDKDLSSEHVSLLLSRAVERASEVDKRDLASLNLADIGDDDVDILEKYFAYVDGDKNALTNKDIDEYTKARDVTGKVNPDHPNKRAKDIIANFIVNKTPEVWMNL